jgi:hypothetical protein
MNDLTMFDDVITELRSGFDDVHYQRPRPQLSHTTTPGLWVLAAAVTVVVSIAVWAGVAGEEIAWAAAGRAPTATEQAWITEDCKRTVATNQTTDSVGLVLPPLMASDVRGNTATLTFAGGGWFVTCVVSVSGQVLDPRFVNFVLWSLGGEQLTEGDGPLRFSVVGLWEFDSMAGTTLVAGTAAPEVDRVVISVPELGEVEATVANGWFTAWWPSRDPFEVRAINFDGNQIAEVVVP